MQLNKTHFYKKGFTIGLFTSNVLFSHNVTTLKNFTKFRHISLNQRLALTRLRATGPRSWKDKGQISLRPTSLGNKTHKLEWSIDLILKVKVFRIWTWPYNILLNLRSDVFFAVFCFFRGRRTAWSQVIYFYKHMALTQTSTSIFIILYELPQPIFPAKILPSQLISRARNVSWFTTTISYLIVSGTNEYFAFISMYCSNRWQVL